MNEEKRIIGDSMTEEANTVNPQINTTEENKAPEAKRVLSKQQLERQKSGIIFKLCIIVFFLIIRFIVNA